MYRADVDSGAVRIGLFLWVYRALFVNATICSNRDSTYRALFVDVQGSFGEYKEKR